MQVGSSELVRAASAWLASLGFAVAFLITVLVGGAVLTAVLRGAAVAAGTLLVARVLLRPLVRVLLDALARDRAARSQEGMQ